MRVLLYGINYAPELTGIGKYSGELGNWLAQRGASVTVVTAPPYYPQWCIQDGYSGLSYRLEQRDGPRIWRCPLWVPVRPSALHRIAHLSSFALTSTPIVAWELFRRKPDVLILVVPSLTCAPAALLLSRLFGVACLLHIQDFEVDAAFELGLLRSRLLQRFVLGVESFLLSRFDWVSTISGQMLGRLQAKGVLPERMLLFPNWVDTQRIKPSTEGVEALKGTLGIPSDQFVVLYSGNLGEKQGLESLLEAAELLWEDKSIVFIFCGAGPSMERLKARAKKLSNVKFIPLQPEEHFNTLLNLADLHIIPQRADAADLVLPSKLTGILACGGPLLVTARKGTGLAEVTLAAGGHICPPEDPAALASAITAIAGDKVLQAAMRKSARAYAELKLSKEALLTRFEKTLRALLNVNS